MSKKALITGVTGQDGSYLAEFLLSKGYEVVGTARTDSDTRNIEGIHASITLERTDVVDGDSVAALIDTYRPDEIYNLSSVSTVMNPWDDALATIHSTGILPLYFLEAIRYSHPHVRFFQASSAEMYGYPQQTPQNELTRLSPRNPYGAGKILVHGMIDAYRTNHGMYAVSGILFNHESPRRKEHFITRKIARSLARIKLGLQDSVSLGNLEARRDWGYAKEYVEAMWLMLQQDTPKDYVIATGETHSVREFIEIAARALDMTLLWEGYGAEERGVTSTGAAIISIDPAFFRPVEEIQLVGDTTAIQKELGWKPQTSFEDLVLTMVREELEALST